MTETDMPHLVYAFDAGFADCSLVSAYSALATASRPLRITFLHDGAAERLEARIAALATAFPESRLALHRFDEVLAGRLPEETGRQQPPAGYATLFLAQIFDGRIIYIDGDTLVRADIAELFGADLGGHPIGAALDGNRLRRSAKVQYGWFVPKRVKTAFEERNSFSSDVDHWRHFNAGLILMDTDGLRACGLADAMADIETAMARTSRASADQEWLNLVLWGHVADIDPAWNSLWGNPRTTSYYIPQWVKAHFAASRSEPRIVHFTSWRKPWRMARPRYGLRTLFKRKDTRSGQKYWDEYQTVRARCEACLGEPLFG